MAGMVYGLHELESILPGGAHVRIVALPRTGAAWICARWPCGCRAEGHDPQDLLLLERCTRHRGAPGERELLRA